MKMEKARGSRRKDEEGGGGRRRQSRRPCYQNEADGDVKRVVKEKEGGWRTKEEVEEEVRAEDVVIKMKQMVMWERAVKEKLKEKSEPKTLLSKRRSRW
jgi:hypothetical protein